jgi:hypothetical protein
MNSSQGLARGTGSFCYELALRRKAFRVGVGWKYFSIVQQNVIGEE